MFERICPRCGASLDPCERCECVDTKYIPNQIPIDRTEEIEELVRKNTEGE